MITNRNPYHLQSREERLATWSFYKQLCNQIVATKSQKKRQQFNAKADDLYSSHITHFTEADIKRIK